MMNRYLIIIILLAIGILVTGCSMRLILSMQEGERISATETPTPTETATPTPVHPTATATPTATPEPTSTPTPVPCTSSLEPGGWTGEVHLLSTGSRSGFQVISQESVIALELDIECYGSVTGTASRTGTANITVPLTVNGVCIDEAFYDVSGVVSGTAEEPELYLEMTVREGTINCEVNSRTRQIPGGEQEYDLEGYTQLVQVFPTSVEPNRVEGTNWQDYLYQDKVPGLESMMVENSVRLDQQSAWMLTYLDQSE
jgi:hypothetical protein